jgi:hypothetical protein
MHQMPPVKASEVNIDITHTKWMFVLRYLQMLNSRLIDKVELTFKTFLDEIKKNPGAVPQPSQISQLIDQYLFTPLMEAKNEPSYIQMVSFLSLLFESLNIFASSPYYTIEQIRHYTTNEFKGSKLENYRSSHVELLVVNSREFLFRTITQTNFTENQTEEEVEQADLFGQKLR